MIDVFIFLMALAIFINLVLYAARQWHYVKENKDVEKPSRK